jgi:hypothetical protein
MFTQHNGKLGYQLASLAISHLAPLIMYFAIRSHVASDTQALALAWFIPVVWTLGSSLWLRRIDVFGLLGVVAYGIALTIAIVFSAGALPLFAPPGARIEPAQKTEVFWLRSKVLVAILLHDLLNMIVAHLALAIAREDLRIGDVELGGERQDDVVRNIGWIRQERAQKPNCTELKGKAQARMIVPARV